ncbi:MAG: hypothetical protein NXY57DRAFT_212677 [Lentinula lateritia]|nr:MAG: hypothetical protein NXY57DRAFT_212677 [Lentinula lateritia]
MPTASPPVVPGKRILIRSAFSKSKNRYLSLLNSSSDRVEAFRLEVQYFLWKGRVDEAGEKNKDVQSELRGVELFVKRGSNDYPSGILGQVKYWSDKKTLVERLLFRRKPLRKVSMNIRLQPAVRCTFNPQECILRLLLAESSKSKASGTTGIIVYALKPGRFCSRKDFQTFSEFVIGNSSLKTVAIVL